MFKKKTSYREKKTDRTGRFYMERGKELHSDAETEGKHDMAVQCGCQMRVTGHAFSFYRQP